MANTRGVFFLSKITEEKIPLNEWVGLETVWHSPPTPNTGYYAGGETSTDLVSTIEKVDFSTDTLSPAPVTGLSLARLSFGGTGNVTDGYFGGGYFPGFYSTMDKLTYSTDDTVNVPGANLFFQVAGSAASGNQTNGYFGGGYDIGAGADTSSFTKIQYSDDTRIAVPATQLNSARNDLSAMGNQLSGYFIGGRNPSEVSTIDKLDYSVETCTSSPSLQYPASYRISGAVGNPSFGMVAGGRAGSLIYDTVRKLDYSTDNFSNVPALPVGKFGVASFGNGDFAYFGGGRAVPAITSNFVKIQYSTSTYSPVPNLNLGAARYSGASSGARSNGLSSIKLLQDEATRYTDGAGPSLNNAYFAGGGPSFTSNVEKIDISSDTPAALPSSNLNHERGQLAGTGNSDAGYYGGGRLAPSSNGVSYMDKLTYSTNSLSSVPGAQLSWSRKYLAATGNTNAGYFTGNGPSSSGASINDKLTYSTDTTARVPGAALLTRRGDHGSAGTQSVGYVFAGRDSQNGPPFSSLERITYSTDTTAAVPGANLSAARRYTGSTGNATHGYTGGGFNPSASPAQQSRMDKTTYSTETSEYVPGANLSANRYYTVATGGSSHGYFTRYISLDKCDYASDTTAALPSSSNLTHNNRDRMGESSTRDNGLPVVDPPVTTPSPGTSPIITPIGFDTGYFAGGLVQASPLVVLSTVDKLTYSTDTTAAVPSSANLTQARYGAAGTGNQTHGYFGGGNISGNIGSTMDKTTYSSDTTARVPGADLSVTRYNAAATGNSTQGYFAGGYSISVSPAGSVSSVDKVTYSSDTTAVLPSSANLSISRYPVSATGNETNGYVGGGYDDPAHYTRVDKITYSTDTTAAAPSAFISGDAGGSGRYGIAATGNSTHGYFGGGGYTDAGFPEGSSSYMDKLTYSSDTTAAVPGANLTGGRVVQGATGNSTHGYFGGGQDASNNISTMDKVTYSTDTTAVVPGAELTSAKSVPAAASSRANGLPTASIAFAPNII